MENIQPIDVNYREVQQNELSRNIVKKNLDLNTLILENNRFNDTQSAMEDDLSQSYFIKA